MLYHLVRELRIALRILGQAPGFAFAVISTLALGVACVTVLGSALVRILVAELPYREPESLALVGMVTPSGYQIPASPAAYRSWESVDLVAELAAVRARDVDAVSVEGPVRLPAAEVTAGFFPLLGSRPELGRLFTAADGAADAERTAVLSHGAWSRLFRGEAGALGKSLSLNDQSWTVIGVLPEGFVPPEAMGLEATELWLALGPGFDWTDSNSHGLSALARLAAGTTLPRAQAALAAASANEDGMGVRLGALTAATVGGARRSLGLLLLAVLLVYLVACANLASLTAARWAGRQQEIGVQLALGARRRQLLGRTVAECLWLGLAGGGLGLLAAAWGMEVLRASPVRLPRLAELGFGWPELALGMGLGLGGGLVAGATAALSTLRRPRQALAMLSRLGATVAVRPTLRRVLVVVQLAGAVALVLGAGLLARSLARVAGTDPGFRTSGWAALGLELSRHRYPEAADRRAFAQDLAEQLAGLPGESRVALVSELPLSGKNAVTSFEVEGREKPGDEPPLMAGEHGVSADYFSLVGIPVQAGRAFTSTDDGAAQPVAIVNQALAESYLGGAALGKTLLLNGKRHEVVGVVGGVRFDRLDEAPGPEIYLPFAQGSYRRFEVVLASDLPIEALASAVQGMARAIDPRLPLGPLRRVETLVAAALASRRFPTLLLLACAAAALLLAAVGLYGLVAFLVANRRLETGIRIALGAGRGELVRTLAGEGAKLTLLGLVVGTSLALPVGRLLSSFLYGVPVHDPLTLAGVAALLALVAGVASYLPARRMLAAEPTSLLRRG